MGGTYFVGKGRIILWASVSSDGLNLMAATSLSRIVVPYIALVAAFGTALVFAIQHFRRASPVDTKVATDVPAVSKPALDPRAQDPAALAAAKAKVDAMAKALAGSPLTPDSGDGEPAFDIARIEPTGEAVIAGRAMPGATRGWFRPSSALRSLSTSGRRG